MGELVQFPGGRSPGTDDDLGELELEVLRALLARQRYLDDHPEVVVDAESFLANLINKLASLSARERSVLGHPSCTHERMTRMLSGGSPRR